MWRFPRWTSSFLSCSQRQQIKTKCHYENNIFFSLHFSQLFVLALLWFTYLMNFVFPCNELRIFKFILNATANIELDDSVKWLRFRWRSIVRIKIKEEEEEEEKTEKQMTTMVVGFWNKLQQQQQPLSTLIVS